MPGIGVDQVREHLMRVLASATFASATRHRRFLEFIVEQTLAGNQAQIKESVVGSEVFGREAGYDPRADAIVRVEANKLRARLAAYYEGPGRDDRVVIEVPKGSYVPRFTRREQAPPAKAAARPRPRKWPAAIAVALVAALALWYAKERTTTPPPGDPPSVAVLPFLNLTADPGNQYFSDGLAEQLTDALAQIKGLRVAARTSAFTFRSKDADVQEIGRRLGVSALIEGSVRKEDNRVRVTAQLVQTSDGYHIWSQTFERELRDVFAIQDEISQAVARALRVSLSPADRQRMAKRPTDNIDAFDLYLRGRYIANSFPLPPMGQQAISLFEEALKKDPNFALAHNGIASMLFLRWTADGPGAGDLYQPILSAVRHAIEIDPDLADAHATLGSLLARHDWKWTEAEKTLRRAIELNPNSPDVHAKYAQHVLLPLHRFDEALKENGRAIELDPFTVTFASGQAWILNYAGRSDEAVAEYRKVLARWPNNLPVQAALTGALFRAGRYTDALTGAEALISADPRLSPDPRMALLYDRLGRRAEAERVKRELALVQPRDRTTALYTALALGRLDEARKVASAMIHERSANVLYLTLDPLFRPLRDDPAFEALLRQTGLPLD